MSKIPVGQGFSFPDTTQQETAGVISDSSRGLFYSLSGDSALNGLSPEKAKASIQDAIDAAQALVPSPSTGAIAIVNEAEGGVYFEDIVLYDNVLFEGTQTAIVTSGMVGVVAASGQSFRPQAIITNTDGASLVVIDGQEQFGLDVRSITLGGDGCIGFDVQGNNSGLFITASEVRVAAENVTVVKYTGMSDIPSDFNFNTVILGGGGATFFEYDAGDSGDTVDINLSSLNSGPVSVLSTSTCGFKVKNGILKVRAGTIGASVAVETEQGGIASVSANVIGGDTFAAGDVVYDTVGVVFGNLETAATGSILWRGSSITGNATNVGSMSIKCDAFNGEIVNTGNMYVQIGDYTGTLPVDDGSIDGVINGIRYGNWKPVISWVNDAGVQTQEDFYVNPQTVFSESIEVGYTKAKVTLSFDAGINIINRSVVVALNLNGVQVKDEFRVEPKASLNNYWVTRSFPVTLLAGSNTLLVAMGRAGGASASFAYVRNATMEIEQA